MLFQYNAEVQLTEMNEGAGSRSRDVLGAGTLRNCVAWAGANDIVLDSSRVCSTRPRRLLARSWLVSFAATSCRTCCSLTSRMSPNF